MRKPVLTLATGALVAFAALGLTGCVGQLQDAIKQGTEQAIEEAAKDSGVDVDLGGGASVPDGWPGEVPVPAGEISFSGKVDKSFSVIMLAEQSAVNGAIEQMRAGGFTEVSDFAGGDGRMLVLENGSWNVSMLIGKDESSGKMSLVYTVTPVTP